MAVAPATRRAHSTAGFSRRSDFTLARRCLLSRRRSREAFVGFVGRRRLGRRLACRMRSTSRCSASSRLRSRLRCDWAVMMMTPSCVRRLPASFMRRMATSFGREGERRASKRSCTALAVLLTCWPPGPEARIALSSISLSSIPIWPVMCSMAYPSGRVQGARLEPASPA